MLLTTLFVLFIFIAGASAKTTYTIRKGDSLYAIAKKFQVSTQDIQKENRVCAKNLKPGTKLVIPDKDQHSHTVQEAHTQDLKETAVSSKPAAKDTDMPSHDLTVREPGEKEGALTGEPSKYHTVKKGDTLKNIAAKYSVSVSDIRTLNGLTSHKLRAGQKLMVRHSGPRTYTVRKGDTLWKIARKYEMDADDLMEINEMSAPSLRVGQKLYLEEKPDVLNVDQKYLVMANTIEEEIKKVSESSDFAEMTTQDKLVTFAKKLLNIPYKFGGSTILGIDCSAYVKKVYGFLGMDLPRTAREQFNEGQQIDKEELLIGDLVFFRTYASFPSHVGIYVGNNLFIHASSKGRKVTINSLDTPYYLKRFIGAKRLISETGRDSIASADPSS